jgi:hypothetical protein
VRFPPSIYEYYTGAFPETQAYRRKNRLLTKPLGGVGGPKPSGCNPKPATCAAVSEALRSKVSIRRSPPVNEVSRQRAKARQSGENHFADMQNRPRAKRRERFYLFGK